MGGGRVQVSVVKCCFRLRSRCGDECTAVRMKMRRRRRRRRVPGLLSGPATANQLSAFPGHTATEERHLEEEKTDQITHHADCVCVWSDIYAFSVSLTPCGERFSFLCLG